MNVLHEINATVAKIIEDLELVVKADPECTFSYSDTNSNDWTLSSVCLIRKEDLCQEYDLVILKSVFEDEGEAISASDLLEKLKKLPSSAKVVLGDWFELKNLVMYDDHYFSYEDEYGSFSYDDCDIRLHTLKTLQRDMQRFADRCPDRRIVVLGKRKSTIFINCMYGDDGMCFMQRSKKGEDITVSSFLEEEFYWDDSGLGVRVFDKYDDSTLNSIQVAEDGTIFFEYKVGDEEVIACRLGDEIYDEEEEEISWEDMCDDEWEDDADNEENEDSGDCATVGQFIKELEMIVKNYPNAFFSYGQFATHFVTGIHMIEGNVVLLEGKEELDDAIDATTILEELHNISPSTKVKIECYGEITDIVLTDKGRFTEYEIDSDGYDNSEDTVWEDEDGEFISFGIVEPD